MNDTGWHLAAEDLHRYAEGRCTPPTLWSVEAHLLACVACRARLADTVGEAEIDAGWQRLDLELDAPVPGPVERLMQIVGVPRNTARLLAATPTLRLSWLGAIGLTLVLTAVLASVVQPVVFLAVAPLIPLLGVAASFGPRTDPTYELTIVAPIHTLRLLLLRCAGVLSVTTMLSALATLAMPGVGATALGWFLPALALTLLSLVLTPRLGPVPSAVSVAVGWLVLVLVTLEPTSISGSAQSSVMFAPAGQAALAGVGALAALALSRLRSAFDIPRAIDRTPRRG